MTFSIQTDSTGQHWLSTAGDASEAAKLDGIHDLFVKANVIPRSKWTQNESKLTGEIRVALAPSPI